MYDVRTYFFVGVSKFGSREENVARSGVDNNVLRRSYHKMKKTRDHSGRHDLSESSRQLKRVSESIAKKMRRFPEGRYAILVGAMTQEGRLGAARRSWKVIGDDAALNEAVHCVLPEIEGALNRNPNVPDVDEFLAMPGNAEKRARKLRRVLATAWKFRTEGTKFEGTKQMYAVTKNNPEMIFEWWDDVTGGAPFTNTAVDEPGVSEKVFRYLAPKVYEMMILERTQ